jgi:hypothetical protein
MAMTSSTSSPCTRSSATSTTPQVLGEARRLVRPGETVAIFDGDYASLTFAYPDHALAKTTRRS